MDNEFNPNTTQMSKLRFYSIGIVAENKALKSKHVEVTPTEEMPMLNGELAPVAVDYKAKAVNNLGSSYETTVETTTTIKALWLPIGAANRITAPDVRRGELVNLYKFGDTDQYFWNTLNDDVKLRKLETVIYAFSATMNEAAEINDKTYYFIEISTHKKLITLHTSKDNGEPYGYDIQLDTGNGKLVITDDVGNYILLDSSQSQIKLQNIDGSTFDMIGPVLNIKIPNQINVLTPLVDVVGSIHATGTIIDDSGNTNHHGH